MPARWEFVRETKGPRSKVEAFLAEPRFVEALPKRHPDFIKKVGIKNKEGNETTYEQQIEIMGRRMNSLNKMTVDLADHRVLLDTTEGTGKGSRIVITFTETSAGGTQLKFSAEMELGPLGFLAKGRRRPLWRRPATKTQNSWTVSRPHFETPIRGPGIPELSYLVRISLRSSPLSR